jgi:hypothetical protein
MLSREAFNEGMAALSVNFTGDVDKAKLKMNYNYFKQYSDREFLQAIDNIIKSRKFSNMPVVAEILEFLSGSLDEQADLALRKLETAMARVGGNGSVCFDDPAIHAAIERFEGGWIGICEIPGKDWTWWGQKKFIHFYTLHAKDNPTDLTPLLGRNDLNSRGIAQYEIDDSSPDTMYIPTDYKPKITYIGNIEKFREQGLLDGSPKLIEGGESDEK